MFPAKNIHILEFSCISCINSEKLLQKSSALSFLFPWSGLYCMASIEEAIQDYIVLTMETKKKVLRISGEVFHYDTANAFSSFFLHKCVFKAGRCSSYIVHNRQPAKEHRPKHWKCGKILIQEAWTQRLLCTRPRLPTYPWIFCSVRQILLHLVIAPWKFLVSWKWMYSWPILTFFF